MERLAGYGTELRLSFGYCGTMEKHGQDRTVESGAPRGK